MIKVCIASNNRNKIKQFGEIFSEKNVDAELFTAKDVGMGDFPPEDGTTFYGNSFIKAKALYDFMNSGDGKSDCYILADDSGISVDALGGAPGVHSARFAGEHATDEENNLLLQEKLTRVSNRAAHYSCAVTLITPGGRIMCTGGRVDGEIISTPRGHDGFGYDPYFYYEGYGKTFAELTSDERNAISHRGRALGKAVELIIADIGGDI